MKYRKLLASGLAFVVAVVLIACGIFIPTTLLQAQETQVLQKKYAFPIDAKELENSDTAISIANADPEYLELLYRFRMMNAIVSYTDSYTILEDVKENELGREAAVEKAKQELLRLMDLGACPKQEGLDDYIAEEASLMGHDENIGQTLREIVLEGMKEWGYDVSELTQIDQRFCFWRIRLRHKTEKEKEIQVDLDAQTGKIYHCMIISNEQPEDYINEAYALMFGKYHNLMEYSASDNNIDDGYYYQFYSCRFDQIAVWSSFDVNLDENNEQNAWVFSCAVQPAYYY